jgi:hypothetical protein
MNIGYQEVDGFPRKSISYVKSVFAIARQEYGVPLV